MTMLWAISLAAAAAPAAAVDFETTVSEWDGVRVTHSPGELRPTMLAAHNEARAEFGVAPLEWDDELARSASGWAERLALGWPFSHDPQRRVRTREGENIFKGTRGAFSFSAMAQLWIDEQRWFQNGRFPEVVTEGAWPRVGHFTQVVWPETRRVGCAIASSPGEDFLVCRYYPAGNIVGEAL